MDRIFQNIRANFLEILEFPHSPEFHPKFPKFPKWPDLADRIFQNIRANLLDILEISETRKGRGEILEILELSLGGRIVTHPMQKEGMVCQRGGGDHTYVHTHTCLY